MTTNKNDWIHLLEITPEVLDTITNLQPEDISNYLFNLRPHARMGTHDHRTIAEKIRDEDTQGEQEWLNIDNSVSDQMDNAEYIEYLKHINEGHKRMKESMDATPTADQKQVSGNHYKDMPMQPWTVMEAVLTHAEFIGYLKGNIIKYSLRAGRKEGSDDAGKAKHYVEKLNEIAY
jgi:hypothetical protein